MSKETIPLSQGWHFTPANADHIPEARDLGVLPARALPSEVHLDLLENGKIADPYLDLNELECRWVAECGWTYTSTFATPSSYGQGDRTTDLVFEGLDTFATVRLNGKEILTSDNMFVSHRVNVDGQLRAGEENELEVRFDSARQRGLQLLKEHPEHRWIVHQTELSRGPVRKAQYHWGWDWGPITLGCGIWKPISVEIYETRIEDLAAAYVLDKDLKSADVSVSVTAVGQKPGTLDVELSFQGEVVYSKQVDAPEAGADQDEYVYKVPFIIQPKLWWPRNYGAQPLYDLKVDLRSPSSSVVDSTTKRIGFRKAELITEPDSHGTSFYFRVNDVDVFIGGSCWIPGDSFPTRVSPQKYRDWVRLAADGNQTMIRVWGGGIYESGDLFAACDELGVLAWQDFGFACANYPAYDAYLKSVELEARQNVRRLRHHASLVAWAGNNEDYQIVERYGLEYRFEEDKDPQSWLKTDFPARYIYEHLLPRVVDEETKGTVYRPSSPWGNGTSLTKDPDPTVGDVHQWGIWHRDCKPYQHLPRMGGRFVSEFGLEAYPARHTLEGYVTDPAQRHVGSRTMDFHDKDLGHERHVLTYTGENFRLRYELDRFAHLTQIMQADGVTWAYKIWRKMWGSAGQRECGGVLIWMLNDSWPGVSWAVADYNLLRKAAYYAIKRIMAPVTVGVGRKFFDCTTRPADETWKRETAHVDPRLGNGDVEYDVWVASSVVEDVRGTVVVRFISVDTGREVVETARQGVTARANSTTNVVVKKKLNAPAEEGKKEAAPVVIHATFYAEDGETVIGGSDVSWPDPIKYLDFADRGVEVKALEGGRLVEVKAAKPVKGFMFEEVPGRVLSDNGFDLVPGETKVVKVEGSAKGELEWTFVGKE